MLAATCGGVGRAPFAPGTWGALVGLALSPALAALAASVATPAGAPPRALETLFALAICLAGVPICARAAVLLGRGKDPGAIVYDEMAAMPLVLLAVPAPARSAAVLAAAFLLFRVFDIAKPFPCKALERLPAGWGIMADDWGAAAWAAAALELVRRSGWPET